MRSVGRSVGRIVALWLALVWCAAGAVAQEDARVLVTQGNATASATPDFASVEVGAVATGATAREALSDVAAATAAALRVLAEAGVADSDVQTAAIYLTPIYANNRSFSESAGAAGPQITGFEARNGLRLTIRDLDGLGTLLDDLVRTGSNQIGGISFAIANPEPALDQARADAVRDARRKAEIMAEAAGVTLGAVRRIAEGVQSGAPGPFLRAEASGFATELPLAQGSLELAASVTVEFELLE
ncbi:MAG: SIMPL domain-containing protein [Pseudomonadota bacterium]